MPIEVSAQIGEDPPLANESGMSSEPASAAAASWVPAPSTPTGPLPADQCHFICGIPGCINKFIVHSYVSLPEGTSYPNKIVVFVHDHCD